MRVFGKFVFLALWRRRESLCAWNGCVDAARRIFGYVRHYRLITSLIMIRWFLFCKNSRPATPMISDSLGVEKKGKQSKKTRVREIWTRYLKIPAEVRFFPPPACLISHLECDVNEKKKTSSNRQACFWSIYAQTCVYVEVFTFSFDFHESLGTESWFCQNHVYALRKKHSRF